MQVDASAAKAVVDSGMTGSELEHTNSKSPAASVVDLVLLTVTSTVYSFKIKLLRIKSLFRSGSIWRKLRRWSFEKFNYASFWKRE